MSNIDQRVLNARMPLAKNILLFSIASLFVIVGTPLLWFGGAILKVNAKLSKAERHSVPVLDLQSR